MRHRVVELTAVFVCVILAGCGCGRRSRAQFESTFVHHEKSGGTFASGMEYENGVMPDRGWDDASIVVGVTGGKVGFAFTFLGHREGKDMYRVDRSFPPGDEKAKTMSVEVAYDGGEIVLFDDDIGKAVLRPGVPNN